MPLARPVELVRMNASSRLLSTSSTPSSSIRKSGAASSMSVRKRPMPSIPSYTPPTAANCVSNFTFSAAGAIALGVPRVDRRDRALNHSHVLLRHRLPPFLDEAFGGSTGVVDVIDRKARDQ